MPVFVLPQVWLVKFKPPKVVVAVEAVPEKPDVVVMLVAVAVEAVPEKPDVVVMLVVVAVEAVPLVVEEVVP